MKHNPEDPIGCQCESCQFIYADADRLAAEIWKTVVTCKRPGCTHNNCVMVDGVCSGNCGCKAA